MKKIILKSLKVLGIIAVLLYITICVLFYAYQEEAYLFFPNKLEKTHKYTFNSNFEELDITTKDGKNLNGLLFKTENSKGLIFYLHGNGGSLESWGKKASFYTEMGYDIFMIDYRGYGKSESSITSEKQLHEDVQIAYNTLKKNYSEDKIVVLGYSLGSGLATHLASKNNPKLLILQAPYYNINDASRHLINTNDSFILKMLKIFPTSLLNKYKITTNKYIQECKMPIVMFHGDEDKLIYHGSALKLEKLLKPTDKLITLKGHNHYDFVKNEEYKRELSNLLK